MVGNNNHPDNTSYRSELQQQGKVFFLNNNKKNRWFRVSRPEPTIRTFPYVQYKT